MRESHIPWPQAAFSDTPVTNKSAPSALHPRAQGMPRSLSERAQCHWKARVNIPLPCSGGRRSSRSGARKCASSLSSLTPTPHPRAREAGGGLNTSGSHIGRIPPRPPPRHRANTLPYHAFAGRRGHSALEIGQAPVSHSRTSTSTRSDAHEHSPRHKSAYLARAIYRLQHEPACSGKPTCNPGTKRPVEFRSDTLNAARTVTAWINVIKQYRDELRCIPQDLAANTGSSGPRPIEMGFGEACFAPHLVGHSPASPIALRWGPGAAAAQALTAPLLALHFSRNYPRR